MTDTAQADPDPARGARTQSAGPPRRVITVAVLAQAVEYFDFFVFATASAIFLGPLFFSQLSGTAATLAAFGTFAVGFVARPLGGAVAGHFGDRYGRKPVLVASNLLMGMSTFVIGLLPTAAAIGWAAPAVLIAMRILQGFALGGQWGGASLLLTEGSPAARRGFFGSFVQIGAQLGLIGGLSSYFVLSLAFSDQQMLSWGWRIPFLSGIVMVGIGLYIHRTIEDTPMFRRLEAERSVRPAVATQPAPIVRVVREHWRTILLAGGAFVLPNAVVFIIVSGMLNYGVQALELRRDAVLGVILAACVCPLFCIPYFAHLSDRYGRPRLFLLGALGVAVWAWPMFALIDTANLWLMLVALVVCFVGHSMMFGPQVALYSELFPTEVRYSGASLGYQVGTVFGGGLAPLVTASLLAATHTSWSVAGYIDALAVISVTSMLLLRRQADAGANELQ
ncbi:MFS transporter [Mycolicibacterium arseniciresistens]|uniref:MFS transporter n=1 Tax=Mycolicibacterium arseniciresistens TaxID=3062257 RepID=A0ABT8UB09_9MYCO|nr:MFS transporter [Mycolicibacterium arseniciresistens]MDO3634973.1 MFS transporter [Mycolicibacterium arseniciresistens]